MQYIFINGKQNYELWVLIHKKLEVIRASNGYNDLSAYSYTYNAMLCNVSFLFQICQIQIVSTASKCRIQIVWNALECRLQIVSTASECQIQKVWNASECRIKIMSNASECRMKIMWAGLKTRNGPHHQ